MSRRSLGIVALILIMLMAVVATAGLDNLPRSLHRSVTETAARLDTDRTTFERTRRGIEQALQNEPELFRDRAARWQQRLATDQAAITTAAAALASAQAIEKADRRTDSDQLLAKLGETEKARAAVNDAAQIKAEADVWLGYKRDLPKRVDAMRASYEALQSTSIETGTEPVRKASTDWPDKSADLNSRLEALNKIKADGEAVWAETAEARAAAADGKIDGFDYASFFTKADRLDSDAKQLAAGIAAVNALAGQLYVSRDKLLLDIDEGDRRQQVRVVSTRFNDSTMSNGQPSSEEKWEPLDPARERDRDRAVGMVIERKPAGKYDSEAERVTQPPGYAYIAPPGQSNAYGAWSGGVWNWLPQYLLLSQLLHASRTPYPVTTGDYGAWQNARRRGDVFYGRDGGFTRGWRHRDTNRQPSGGLGGLVGRMRDWSRSREDGAFSRSPQAPPSRGGGWYTERPREPSWGDRGYSGSKYQSRGGYSGSRYQSRGGYSSGRSPAFGSRSYSRGWGGGGRSFGRGGRR